MSQATRGGAGRPARDGCGSYYVTSKTVWADWFLSLAPTTCAQFGVRLDLFLATKSDIGPAFARLLPSQACAEERKRLVRELFDSVESWKHVKERTQPADWLAKNGNLLDGDAVNLLLFYSLRASSERSLDWAPGVLAHMGKLSDKQLIVHLRGFPSRAQSLAKGVAEAVWAATAAECQTRRRPGALAACAMYNGPGRLPGVDRVLMGMRAMEALTPKGPEWSEAVEVLHDELLHPGGTDGYNEHDCTWLGQAMAKLGKATTSVVLERYLRDRLECDDPDGRASLRFIWSQ